MYKKKQKKSSFYLVILLGLLFAVIGFLSKDGWHKIDSTIQKIFVEHGDIILSTQNLNLYIVKKIDNHFFVLPYKTNKYSTTKTADIHIPLSEFSHSFTKVGTTTFGYDGKKIVGYINKNEKFFATDRENNKVFAGDIVFTEENGSFFRAVEKADNFTSNKEIIFVPVVNSQPGSYSEYHNVAIHRAVISQRCILLPNQEKIRNIRL